MVPCWGTLGCCHILSRTLASVYDLNDDGITVWVTKGAQTTGTGVSAALVHMHVVISLA